jgi:hypothetical protein
MQALVNQLTGTWTFKQIQITPQPFSHGLVELGISKDTLITGLGTLTLAPSAQQPVATQCHFEGLIRMGDKNCPVQFSLIAGPGLSTQKGSQAFFLVDYDFPISPYPLLAEHIYLEQLGIIKESFSLEIPIGQPTMLWRGQNRQVEQIQFVKH